MWQRFWGIRTTPAHDNWARTRGVTRFEYDPKRSIGFKSDLKNLKTDFIWMAELKNGFHLSPVRLSADWFADRSTDSSPGPGLLGSDYWAHGLLGPWLLGPRQLGPWTTGLADYWARDYWARDNWAHVQPGSRTTGLIIFPPNFPFIVFR